MNEQLMQVLTKLNLEGNHDEIIKLTESYAGQQPTDILARYCTGMAYVAKGNKTLGLKHLRELINISLRLTNDEPMKMFVRRVILQVVQITEMNLHDGEILGLDSLKMVKDIRDFSQSIGDTELQKQGSDILNRWWHDVGGKMPVIGLLPDSPMTLQVEPTNVCNLNCRMCPRQKMTRQEGFMELSLYEDMLYTWKNRYRTISIPHLIFKENVVLLKKGAIKLFFMGEPLLHPQFDCFITLGNSAGCSVGVQTNGVALQKEDIRSRLLMACPSAIGVSLDGMDKMTYEAVRQGGYWDQIIDSLRKLHKERETLGLSKKVWIMVSSILPEWNDQAAKHAQEFLSPIRPYVDRIGFVPLSRERDPEFYNNQGEVVKYDNIGRTIPSKNQPLCSEALTKVNVLWDGTITPCCYDIDGAMNYGHVRDGIDKTWQSAKVKTLHDALLRHKVKKYPLCKLCMGL